VSIVPATGKPPTGTVYATRVRYVSEKLPNNHGEPCIKVQAISNYLLLRRVARRHILPPGRFRPKQPPKDHHNPDILRGLLQLLHTNNLSLHQNNTHVSHSSYAIQNLSLTTEFIYTDNKASLITLRIN
jgi:hypothetical protein